MAWAFRAGLAVVVATASLALVAPARPAHADDETGVGCFILGSLVDDAGRPVVGAAVSVVVPGTTPFRSDIVTDLEGRFELAGLPAGPAVLVVIAGPAASATRDLRLTHGTLLRIAARVTGAAPGAPQLEIDVDEEACVGDVQGRVVRSADAAPAEGVIVVARQGEYKERTGRTNVPGQYVITGVPCGPVEVMLDREPRGVETVAVRPGRSSAVGGDLVLGPPVTGGANPPGGGGNRLVRAKAWTARAGSTMTLVASEVGVGARPFSMPEVMTWRSTLGLDVPTRLGVQLGVSLLPKDPALAASPLFQSADLTVRVRTSTHWFVAATGALGTTLGTPGAWRGGALVVDGFDDPSRYLRLSGSLGSRLSVLDFDDAPDAPWLVEIVATGRLAFGEFRRGDRAQADGRVDDALWFAFELGVPAASGGTLPGLGDYDAEASAGISFGADVELGAWRLTTAYRFFERGDAAKPETMLPVLQGGFPVSELILGLERRLGGGKAR